MTIYYVSTSGNDSTGNGSISKPYATIGKAIMIAVNGDVIEVAAGTYTGNIIVNKSVTLLGQDKTTTIIQPSTTTATATVQITDGASGTIIKNLTVKGKFATQTTTGAGNAEIMIVLFCF